MEGNTAEVADQVLELRPLNPHFGVEVLNVDLSTDPDARQREALAAAFRKHRLLLLRGQDITTDQQTRFAEIFGEVSLREKNRMRSTEAKAQHVSNVRDDGVFGKGELDFHLDQLFHAKPLSALMLYGIEVPDEGGDTLFSDSVAVVSRMPASLRDRIEDLSCRNAYTFAGALAADWNVDDAAQQRLEAVHPMVWREQPDEPGALWVNKLSSLEVLGLAPEEGGRLMAEARAGLYDEEVIYRHKWRVGDLILWDNRRLQHARTLFDPSARRTLRRSPIL